MEHYANKGNGNIRTRELGGQWIDASGWLALWGAQARECARIARESCALYRNCCGQYTEWCCELVLYTPLVETAISRHERHDSLHRTVCTAAHI